MKIGKYILVSNDDGVSAPGLKIAVDCARKYGKVIVVAPSGPRSAQSSAISVISNLKISFVEMYNGVEFYAVNGTPVDCVKLAVYLFGIPDVVIGGVNHGPNDGNAVIYSGTMGIVLEGCMLGVPSIGFSHTSHSWDTDFVPYVDTVSNTLANIIKSGLPTGVCLNVNMPAGGVVKGIRTVRAAKGYWIEEFEKIDSNSFEDQLFENIGERKSLSLDEEISEYKMTGKFLNLENNAPDTDCYWLKRNYATVVPVRADMSALCSVADFKPIFDADYV